MNFKNLIGGFLIGTMVLLSAGCGQRVEVAPAQIGKIMTNSGYQKGTISTSKFRLESCAFTACDKLVTLDQSDKTQTENVTIFMPADKLQITVPVQATLAVNPTKVDSLFDTLPPEDDKDSNDQTAMINWGTIYKTYAQSIIASETTSFISKYTIAELSSNLERINSELRQHLTAVINKRTPFTTRYIGISRIQYPSIITDAQEKAGDPLPSRLREPKQSSIQEKIDIKDEVKEILKK